MAEDKKSFLLYADLIHTVRKMPKDKAGELFLTILSYVNDENPIIEDILIDVVFEPIKLQLKRDLKAWEEIKETKSNGAKLGNLKRWNIDLYNKVMSNELTISDAENIVLNRKSSHSDSMQSDAITQIAVNVNDTVTVNVNDIEVEEEKTAFDKNFQLEPKSTCIKIEDCFHKQYASEMKTESEWMENTSRQLKIDLSKIPKALEDFNSHLITIGKKHPTKRLYKEHFVSWARKAKEISESKQRQSKQDRL